MPWKKILEWNPPWAKWLVGGKLNTSYNCLHQKDEGLDRFATLTMSM